MLGGEGGIGAAVGLEAGFEILQALNEIENCRLVIRQAGATDANGPTP
jgi:hypothetical protein